MNTQYKNVYPFKRIVASIYDSLLLLSVIFVLAYLSVFILNGFNWELPDDPSQPILPGWYAVFIISFTSWGFFTFFGFGEIRLLEWQFGILKSIALMVAELL